MKFDFAFSISLVFVRYMMRIIRRSLFFVTSLILNESSGGVNLLTASENRKTNFRNQFLIF